MTVSRPYGNYHPYGISQRVPNMEYAADVNIGHPYVCNFGAPVAADTDGILDGVQMVNGSAVTVNTFTAGAGTATAIGFNGMVPFDSLTVDNGKGWGRCLTFVASSTNTRVATIIGYDYLGSKMIEEVTLTSGSPVSGKKAFAWIESISFSSASDTTTVDVGFGNTFGVPYAMETKVWESKNGTAAANAGTVVSALADATAATATNADVRGTILFSTVLPDGSNTFEIGYTLRRGNLHGNAQYAG
jgi:hypothetical protein